MLLVFHTAPCAANSFGTVIFLYFDTYTRFSPKLRFPLPKPIIFFANLNNLTTDIGLFLPHIKTTVLPLPKNMLQVIAVLYLDVSCVNLPSVHSIL